MEASASAATERWEPNLDTVRLEDLPEGFREVAETIGLTAALSLVEWRGGSRLAVPVAPNARHPLARLLGTEPALALARQCGGTCVHIPSAREACRAARDRAIRRDRLSQGVSWPALVRRYGLAERRIRQIVAGKT